MKNRFLTFIAVFIGLGAALITQSFKPVEPNRWGVNGATLVDISSLTRDDDEIPAENTYTCDDEPSEICSGTYVGTPTSPEQLSNTEEGIFSVNQ